MCPFELEPTWKEALRDELEKPYIAHLAAFLEKEWASEMAIFPPKQLIFNSLWQTPFHEVKVLIMGQDPYHAPGQAHGLSFSVPVGVPLPPSLQNIYKELLADLGIPMAPHGCLLNWARQGVLLLNATLTVRQGEPMSHHGRGWEQFTDAIVERLSEREDPLVFVLWGKSAQEKCRRLPGLKRHHVLTTTHPSPLSAHQGFLGCRHFSKVNNFLVKNGKQQINWKVDI